MKKYLTALAVLTVFATPAFAQSFDPDNGSGNVLSFGAKPTAAYNGNWGFAPGNGKYDYQPRTYHTNIRFSLKPVID